MSNRVALVSGANKGIGKEVAKQLGEAGFKVLLGCRDINNGEIAATELKGLGIDAEAIELDISDSKSVESAAAAVAKKHEKLDVLVNNAGIANDRSSGLDADVELIRTTLDTNFLGAVRLTKALVPLLQKSDGARVVNVSSTLGSLNKNADPQSPFADLKLIGYNSSKAALNMFTIIAAGQFKDSKTKVNSACPGYVATDLNAHEGVRSVEQGARIIVKLATLDEHGPTGQFFDDDGPIAW